MELHKLDNVFSPASSKRPPSIEITDLYATPKSFGSGTKDRIQTSTVHIFDASSIKRYLNDLSQNSYHARVISITKAYPWGRLDLQRDMLDEVLGHYNATTSILEMVHSFRFQENRLEEAYTDSPLVQHDGEIIEIVYTLKQAERRKPIDAEEQWSVRQTGIYHRYNVETNQSTYILIFPCRNASTYQELIQKITSSSRQNPFLAHPLSLHLHLFHSRLYQWRLCISHFEYKVWELGNLALTVDIRAPMPFNETFKNLSDLYYIESRLSPISPLLTSSLELASKLGYLATQFRLLGCTSVEDELQTHRALENACARLRSYQLNLTFVLKKIQSATQFISDTISLKNQSTSSSLSVQMLALNKSAVEDSTSMRVITIVTLVYLPSSFVSTFFGMGFFSANDDSVAIWSTSQYVWIFFLISIPLTLLTLGYWNWNLGKAKRARAMKEAAGV